MARFATSPIHEAGGNELGELIYGKETNPSLYIRTNYGPFPVETACRLNSAWYRFDAQRRVTYRIVSPRTKTTGPGPFEMGLEPNRSNRRLAMNQTLHSCPQVRMDFQLQRSGP